MKTIVDHLFILWTLSSTLSLSSCSVLTSFMGTWMQSGVADLITINNTIFSLKGTCLNRHQDEKYKYIYYNEQTRCKRCVLFIPRHVNVLQYRESECFDVDDDDHNRICGSITPDTVLYTLFRDNAETIPCPFGQSWHFKRNQQIVSPACQPKAFHGCFSAHTFRISYYDRCQSNTSSIAKCFAQFSDGNLNYVIARNLNQRKFICFSYVKTKLIQQGSFPNEVYLSEDDSCRGLLTRESALTLTVVSEKYHKSKVQSPDWTRGTWLSMDAGPMNVNLFYINQSQLMMKMNNEQLIKYRLRFKRILTNKRHEKNIQLRAESTEECSSIMYCVKFVYRSLAVIDLSIAVINKTILYSGEYQCQDSYIHYTLYKPFKRSNISCPYTGIYKSFNIYQSSLPISTCSIAQWTLSIGCQTMNSNELTVASSCRHDSVPDVQVITSIKGNCLATWRTDHRFQRTIIIYETSKAFCLIQPLKSMTASWIFAASSCTNIGLSSIHVENSLRHSDTCQQSHRLVHLSSSSLPNSQKVKQIFYLSFYLIMKVFICM